MSFGGEVYPEGKVQNQRCLPILKSTAGCTCSKTYETKEYRVISEGVKQNIVNTKMRNLQSVPIWPTRFQILYISNLNRWLLLKALPALGLLRQNLTTYQSGLRGDSLKVMSNLTIAQKREANGEQTFPSPRRETTLVLPVLYQFCPNFCCQNHWKWNGYQKECYRHSSDVLRTVQWTRRRFVCGERKVCDVWWTTRSGLWRVVIW